MTPDQPEIPRLTADMFEAAADRIGPHIRRTPLRQVGPRLWVKCEHEQRTGSFKLRGALNKVLQLDESARADGVICASAGNHGLGVATACAMAGFECTVFVPQGAPAFKTDPIREAGAELILVKGDYGLAEQMGLRAAAASDSVWISPYNDLDVILGQGSVGLELADQFQDTGLEDPVVFVPASGGGLVCGIGLALSACRVAAEVVAVQTAAAPYLFASLQDLGIGSIVERPTIADGLAGPVEAGSITLSLLPAAVARCELVEEDEIEGAIAWLAERGEMVEPSAAVGVATGLREAGSRPCVAVLTGSSASGRRAHLELAGGA